MSYTNFISDDRNSIPYRPKLNKITGSMSASIVLTQTIYWARLYNFKPFYKFKEPCKHSLYQEGKSWIEELEITTEVFDKAMSRLKKYILTRVSQDGITYYTVNRDILETDLVSLYMETSISYPTHISDSNYSGDLIIPESEKTIKKGKKNNIIDYTSIRLLIETNLLACEEFKNKSLSVEMAKTQEKIKKSYKCGIYCSEDKDFYRNQVETLIEKVYDWNKKKQNTFLEKVENNTLTKTERQKITKINLYSSLATFAGSNDITLYLDKNPTNQNSTSTQPIPEDPFKGTAWEQKESK